METLFIADLHLCPERPQQLQQFRTLLLGPARRATALYILGDLFEQFWAGIDDPTPPAPEVLALLAGFTRSGTPCFVQRGNRDLFLDDRFESLTGCRLLADEKVIDLHGDRVLLMHGDLLCTRDSAYQAFRRLLELAMVRRLFGALPCGVRTALAHGLRPLLRRTTQWKPRVIIDVSDTAVIAVMKRHRVRLLIHGHTHRPAIHDLDVDGAPARRIVLTDWYGEPALLRCRTGSQEVVPVAAYLRQDGT